MAVTALAVCSIALMLSRTGRDHHDVLAVATTHQAVAERFST